MYIADFPIANVAKYTFVFLWILMAVAKADARVESLLVEVAVDTHGIIIVGRLLARTAPKVTNIIPGRCRRSVGGLGAC